MSEIIKSDGERWIKPSVSRRCQYVTVGGGGGRSECTSSQAVDTSSLIDLKLSSSFDREIKG